MMSKSKGPYIPDNLDIPIFNISGEGSCYREMSSYRLGEGFEMKCTPEKLMNSLIEVYSYHFKRACDDKSRDSKEPEVRYQVGKADGAVEACEVLMLQVFGGVATYKIWQDTMKWARKDEVE